MKISLAISFMMGSLFLLNYFFQKLELLSGNTKFQIDPNRVQDDLFIGLFFLIFGTLCLLYDKYVNKEKKDQ